MKKLLISIIILFFIISIGYVVNAKYVIEYKTAIANINIDRKKPYIEILNIINSEDTHQTTLRIKIIEKNIIINNFAPNNLLLKSNSKEISFAETPKITKISEDKEGIVYDIKINNIDKMQNLTLIIKDSIIMDIGGNTNDELNIPI